MKPADARTEAWQRVAAEHSREINRQLAARRKRRHERYIRLLEHLRARRERIEAGLAEPRTRERGS